MQPIRDHRGFTLIELLIVVAIIGILAAIAIPNFLEAQTRAKVSRAQAELRNMAIGIESYYVDYNNYPTPADEADGFTPASAPFEGMLPYRLSTPIAYVSTVVHEIFPAAGSGGHDIPFHYSEERLNADLGDPFFLPSLYSLIFGGPKSELKYMMFSHGPDLDHDEIDPKSYDPTNGTTSSGDIYYWGPGIGLNGL